LSGVEVASTIRSIDCASIPALAIAARAAWIALGGDMALPDTGALHDPLVRGIYPRRQFGIGQNPLRQVGAATEHDRAYRSHETASCAVCA
jgi:hypothetical protein